MNMTNGNLINDGQSAYTWDAENRLIRIQNHGTNAISESIYDASSHAVYKKLISQRPNLSGTVNNLWCGETSVPKPMNKVKLPIDILAGVAQ